MTRERLQLALTMLQPHQWKLFEDFASSFLSTIYPTLRTVASPSGDYGRDAELFSADGKIRTVFQYSISENWIEKIRNTAKRLSDTLPETRILIYVTNKSILSKADSLKIDILDNHNFVLDIHDLSWFLDRLDGDEHRLYISEDLASRIVDPYLSSNKVMEHSAPTLSTVEYQAALTFLQLQWEDDTREKGLTRLSFEALVVTILRDTYNDLRLSREVIHNCIIDMFPDHDKERIGSLVDSALHRLTKRRIRHWPGTDEFCLASSEFDRIRERLIEIEVANSALDVEIQSTVQLWCEESSDVTHLSKITRMALDDYLLKRGEVFASSITNDTLKNMGIDDLQHVVEKIVDNEAKKGVAHKKEECGKVVLSSIVDLLSDPSSVVKKHLRSKADAYTLLAFLGQTPDVQSAVSKMFAHGTIWLDTTIVLPIFAEQLVTEERRRFTKMLQVAALAGLELRITPGVIEEIERHMNRCLIYVHTSAHEWDGRVPFLMDGYMRSGRSALSFASWIENFRGAERPEEDLADYLNEFFDIKRESLEEEELEARSDVREAVQEAWHAVHAKRRDKGGRVVDDHAVYRLVRHDVENYVGVIERREREGSSQLGYSSWWITLDRSVRQVERDIKERLGDDTPKSPVMSADFLVNYLSVGPIRGKITKENESTLPIALDIEILEDLTKELLIEADKIRKESGELPEHVVRRRVRDHLDAAKRRRGQVMGDGIQTVLDAIDADAAEDWVSVPVTDSH